ncbi:DUF1904 domain-containing protein [Alkaliphilus hydrothermalis]|uniref:DUF1904 domain-containing protein n=1 Tax=Alkaliphilus hydrothermalis TaxID=1482730 RepID=A0ABS2NTR8_9FIRM|nr:DUF1904 domain-containing protein [Alkaliphilus hydrothermalis]MBM7616342.1 hypothetical protein [Alkaliphilus hydrothermalis]
MPQIIVRGVSPVLLCKINKELIDELVAIVECPRDYFEMEYIHSMAIREGNIEAAYPFVEVAWFDRGQEIQDQVAKAITKYMNMLGVASLDIAFTHFEKKNYYENGEHF